MIQQNKLYRIWLKVNILHKTSRKFYFLVLLIIPFICGCSNQKNFAGTYRCCKGNYWSSQYINIREDSTYSFLETNCMRKDSSAGTWQISNRKYVILSSKEVKPEDSISYLILKKAERILSDTITVTILDENNEPYALIGCMLYKDQKFIIGREAGFDGVCKIPKVNFDQIVFLNTDKYYMVEDTSYNTFIFKLKYDPFTNYYLPFKNQKFKIKRNKLVELKSNKKFYKQ